MSKITDLSLSQLRKVVKESCNITDALRNIGYTNPRANHTRTHFMRVVEENGIDISHFSTHRRLDGSSNTKVYSMDEILVENSTYTNRSQLKKRLITECNWKYECVLCGNKGEWNGKELSLQLDHINGINNDNRIENLRLLCPNCHSQTGNYSGKNIK